MWEWFASQPVAPSSLNLCFKAKVKDTLLRFIVVLTFVNIEDFETNRCRTTCAIVDISCVYRKLWITAPGFMRPWSMYSCCYSHRQWKWLFQRSQSFNCGRTIVLRIPLLFFSIPSLSNTHNYDLSCNYIFSIPVLPIGTV